jgi:hypothetical protein
MNRILKRPMFRRGGSADGGITSGLRQGYENGLKVNTPEFASKMERLKNQGGDQSVDYGGEYFKKLNVPGAWKQAGKYGYKPRGTNVYDFMTEFGLDLASRPAAGNIFQQMATSAREPYQRFTQRKGEAAEQEYASQVDIFKNLLGAGAEVLASEKEAGAGVKLQYSEEIKSGIRGIWALKDDLDEGKIDQSTYDKEKNIIVQGLDPYLGDNPEIDRLFEVQYYADEAYQEHKAKFLTEELMTIPEGEPGAGKQVTKRDYYSRPENKAKLRGLATDSYMREMGERRLGVYVSAKGGRVGYQNAGAVMPGQGGVMPDQGVAMPGQVGPVIPSDATMAPQEETMPSELGGITYEELRSRLPQTITDDIVRLLVTSSEALEDFATIQTEQDVASFNRKYNVNLVLPAGG